MSFSTRTFIDYVIEQVSDMASLLITYYEVSVQLGILALSTRALLTYIPQIDELLCELFYYQDKVGEGMVLYWLNFKNSKCFLFSLCPSIG